MPTPKRTKMLYFSKFSRECMPPFHYSKHAAITSIFFKFYKNLHQNAGNMSQNFRGKLNTLYVASVQIKSLVFI